MQATDEQRNYFLLFMDNVLFTNAMTFLSITTVITYFLNHLGADTFVISLANALTSIGTFVSQPYFTRRATLLQHKLIPFAKILFFQRFFLLAFVLVIPIGTSRFPHAMIPLFLVCWGVFNVFTGSYSPFYMSLFAKMVAQERRGRLRGFAGGAANLLALLSVFLIGIVLKSVSYPYNYTLLFVIGAILLLLDAYDFVLMKEPPDETIGTNMDTWRYIRDVPRILRSNGSFARMVLGFTLLVIAQISLVYYSLYAIRAYHATNAAVAVFTGIAVVGNTLSSVLFGVLADKFSHRLVLQWGAVAGAAAAGVVLTWHSVAGVYVAFALSTVATAAYNMSSSVLVIEKTKHSDIPMYISIYILVTLIVSSVLTLFSSYVIHRLSFAPVFAATGVASVAAWWAFRKPFAVRQTTPTSLNP